MDFRERVTPPHCRLQLWFALVGFLIPWSQAGKPCELRPEQFRSSLVLQGVQFDGAYALSLHEGLDCLREITTPRGPVNQSLNAIADFYEQFYAFRYICIDPPASSQSQAAPFDFGVYGSPRGGGSSAKDAKIDIVGELRSLAASLPENPGIDQWFLRSNSLFTRLRDAHVDWRNGGTKADTVLNQFIFILQNDATTSPVRMEVSARSAAAVDGFADPRFSCDGMEIESIDGMKPMQWLQLHVLENPAFHYAYKSLGSRANRMLKSARVGFAWLGSRVGDVSSLTPSVEVRFKNGQTTTWSWTWLLLTRSLNACKKYDVNCVLDLLKGPLKAAGTLHQNAVEALGQLQKAHQHDELVNAAPELPDDEMMKLLKEDTGLRSFLKIPEERIPGTQAHYGAMLESRPALDEASFPRRWLLDPALSPLGATYGYYQLQRDESGELFAVVKLTRFYLTEDESAGFQVQSQFTAFWRELVQTSKDHSVSRLLVDLSGNPGGFVDFAYLFVRALHPLLQFAEVCNEYDRPVGSLFHAWKHVNVTPLVNFLKTVAPAEKRVEELSEEKKEHLTQILHAVTKACIAMDVLSYDDYMMIQSAIDTLDMGEMDAYTLQETVQVLSDSAASFGNPFTLFLMAFSDTGQPFDPFGAMRKRRRGGKEDVELTAKFRVEDCVSVYTQEFVDALAKVHHPFSEILFVSDGLCGSSCDTASRTAYMLSKKIEHQLEHDARSSSQMSSPPSVRFMTFGGLGGSADDAKRSLSATAYPGGNVMSSAMGLLYNPIFSAAALGYLAAAWAGLEKMKAEIHVFRERVPQYPYYWEKLPKYPQSEIYQNALGPDALPSEYYFFPTDLFLPEWYADVQGMPGEWNETELKRLHLDAAKGFGSQPNLRSAWSNRLADAVEDLAGSWQSNQRKSISLQNWLGVAGLCLVLLALATTSFSWRRPRRQISECSDSESSASSA